MEESDVITETQELGLSYDSQLLLPEIQARILCIKYMLVLNEASKALITKEEIEWLVKRINKLQVFYMGGEYDNVERYEFTHDACDTETTIIYREDRK